MFGWLNPKYKTQVVEESVDGVRFTKFQRGIEGTERSCVLVCL